MCMLDSYSRYVLVLVVDLLFTILKQFLTVPGYLSILINKYFNKHCRFVAVV